ncbi:hypothetical protein K435DRAFT_867124 [Dendrothele bispora CBS 962.96]|uniref:Uncharacterized protein n=1 Tax=Dendrothele bispora (strain CBS 962.96) TaxID=1314807 RepID=A0A4S8LF40_DENBC|nr:hypothetical protein K435DRAFT_867124 [Dendrothele bispora CBS 962.96]
MHCLGFQVFHVQVQGYSHPDHKIQHLLTPLPIKPSIATVGTTDGSSSPAASILVSDNTTSEQASEIMSDSLETKIFEDAEDWESVDEEDDEYTERTGTLVDFISNIPMHD